MFQNEGLFKNISVRDNLLLASHKTDQAIVELDRRIPELALNELLQRRARELSGGEEAKVQIARCIITDRPIWILDEPTGNLDEGPADWFLTYCLDEVQRDRLVLAVSHDSQWINRVRSELLPSKRFQTWQL
jgi:ABC-type lipoprotein export system ATPase subunit